LGDDAAVAMRVGTKAVFAEVVDAAFVSEEFTLYSATTESPERTARLARR
jgi:hypothetical protein